MSNKSWTVADIRNIARQTVEGRQQNMEARGSYFKALIQTAQAELGGKAGREGQRVAVSTAHKRFYAVVQETIATDAILAAAGFARKDIALERNRRLNFARSAHGTIQRWLRDEAHDLMKLDVAKVSKSQLEEQLPPARKHTLSPQRVKARAAKLIDSLVTYARAIAKQDQAQAATIITQAMTQLEKALGVTARAPAPGKKQWPTDTQILRKERLRKAA